MIISCENCNKKFELDDHLIPNTGRLLECGSCAHKWHYTPIQKTEAPEENLEIKEPLIKEKKIKNEVEVSIQKTKPILKENNEETISDNKDKKISYLNLFIVIIISFIGLVIIFDTFESQLAKFFPNISVYLESLYETLRDISLFINDLF